MLDCCLEPGKIEALKMLDLEKKPAIVSNILHVQHQATNLAFKTSTFLFGTAIQPLP
jgi:hypothetical protein